MKVLLDSTVFCQDYQMTSTNFRLLRESLHVIPAELKVPDVVIDEVVNRYREDLEEALVQAEKAQGILRRLLPAVLEQPLRDIDPEKESETYRDWLLSALDKLGVEILPYPEIPHQKVLRRDLQRKRPFKRNGSGYRDYLIWETVRKLTFAGTERVAFVTGNTRDFGDGPLVAEDLRGEILNPDRLELIPGLRAFNHKFVIPRLEMVEEIRAKLQAETGGYFDIPLWLHGNVLDLLRNEELGSLLLGFPEGAGRVYPSEVVAFSSIAVDDVRRLSQDDILVRVKVDLEVQVTVDIDWDDYTRYPEIRDWAGEGSEEFSFSWSYHREKLDLGINLVLDAKAEELIEYELASISGPWGDIEMASW